MSEELIEFRVSDNQKEFLVRGVRRGRKPNTRTAADGTSSGPVKAAMIVTIQVCTMKQ